MSRSLSDECAVCLEGYSPDRLPKILLCFHKFCETCMRRLHEEGRGRIPCPVCRTVTRVESVEELPSGQIRAYHARQNAVRETAGVRGARVLARTDHHRIQEHEEIHQEMPGNMQEGEIHLQAREMLLQQRDIELEQRELYVQQMRADIQQRLINLQERENNLGARERFIQRREANALESEARIQMRETELGTREQHIQEREYNIREKKRVLEAKKRHFEEVTRRQDSHNEDQERRLQDQERCLQLRSDTLARQELRNTENCFLGYASLTHRDNETVMNKIWRFIICVSTLAFVFASIVVGFIRSRQNSNFVLISFNCACSVVPWLLLPNVKRDISDDTKDMLIYLACVMIILNSVVAHINLNFHPWVQPTVPTYNNLTTMLL